MRFFPGFDPVLSEPETHSLSVKCSEGYDDRNNVNVLLNSAQNGKEPYSPET